MTREEWLQKYQAEFGSKYEALFVERVLPLVAALRYEALVAQYPFRDIDGRQRYCDFVIQEGDSTRIALEIDGYDKRGTGQGPTRDEYLDSRRREASLVALGFRVLRFANVDVRDRPGRCAELITLTLKNARMRSLSMDEAGRLRALIEEMAEKQNAMMDALRRPPAHAVERSSSQKFVSAALVTLVVALAMAVVWLGGWFSAGEPRAPMPVAGATSATAGEAMASPPMRNGVLVAPAGPTTPTGQPAALLPGESGRGVCDFVDSIDEGIAVCIQDDGSIVKTQATPDMREGQRLSAKPLPGSSCENPLDWDSAWKHIGQTRAIAGPVVAVTKSPPNTRGDPTWIEVGARFPNSKRLSLVIWGNRRSRFPKDLQELIGTRPCIVGEVQDYKGVARIELRTPEQMQFQDDCGI